VIQIHIRDDLFDPVKTYVHTEKMRLIGRMHGRGWYARASDLYPDGPARPGRLERQQALNEKPSLEAAILSVR
jgi:hypothetical protein